MILENVKEVGNELLEKNGIKITVSVPKGKELGTKTDNPRIGIMGGISIVSIFFWLIIDKIPAFDDAVAQLPVVYPVLNFVFVSLFVSTENF